MGQRDAKPLTGEERQSLRDLQRSEGWAVLTRHAERKAAVQRDRALAADDMHTVKRARGYVDALQDLLVWVDTASREDNADGPKAAE